MDTYCQRILSFLFVACLHLMLVIDVSAQEGLAVTDRFEIGASLDTRYHSNAELMADDVPSVEEQQTVYGIDVDYAKALSLVNFAANYSISHQDFSKDSQQSDTVYSGTSRVFVGTQSSLFALTATHEAAQVLESPDQQNVLNNQVSRIDYSINPEMRLRLSGVDKLTLSPFFQESKFDDFIENNSQSYGISADWEHTLSSISSIGVIANQSRVTFENSPLLDYDYTSVGVTYNGRSRLLNYELSFGINNIETRNGLTDEDGTYYSVDLDYQGSFANFFLRAQEELSDTSLASSLNSPGTETQLGGGVNIQDQVEFASYEVGSQADSILSCGSCQAILTYSRQNLEYLTQIENDNKIDLFSINFTYRLSPRSSLSTTVSNRKVEFKRDSTRDLENTAYRLSFQRELNERSGINVYYDQTQSGRSDREFDFERIGIVFRYQLR